MKKIAIASAIALASITAAHAAPTVYGKAFLTLDYVSTDYDAANKTDEDTFKLNSNASRIGFKGSEELTDTVNLVYQLEYGVSPDDDRTQFTSRNTYIGLAHNTLGTLIAGRHDTPFRLAKGNADVFNANVDTLSIDNAGPLGYFNLGEYRANNMVAYQSPALVGLPLTFMGAVSLSEQDNVAYTKEKNPNDNGYSASLAYDQNGIYLGGAYDDNVGNNKSAWRLAGQLDMGKMNMVQGLTLGALYQNADVYDKNDDEKSWLISGKYKVSNTPWAVKAQYVNTTDEKGVKDADVNEIAVGGEYAFNKATTGHIYAGQISRDNYKDDTIVGTGIEYKF